MKKVKVGDFVTINDGTGFEDKALVRKISNGKVTVWNNVNEYEAKIKDITDIT